MGTFAEDILAAGNDPQKLAPLLFVVEKYVHLPEERFPKTVAALPALRDQYESGQIDGRWTRSTTQILKDISALMQGRPSMLFDAYTQTIEEAFQKLGVPQKIPGLHAVQSEGYLKLVELEEEGKALEERKAGLDQRRADLEEEEKKLQQAEKQLAKRKQTLAKAEKAVKDGSASAEEIAEYKKQKSALRKRDLRIRVDRELYETHKLELADDERVYSSEKEAFDEKNTLFHKSLEENRTASLKKFKADWQAATTALTTDYAEHLAEATALCDHPVTISSSEISPTANMRSDAAQIKTSEDLREILEKVRLATENGPYWKISGGDPKLLELGNLIRETEQGLEREKAISISDGNGHVRFGHKADPDLVKRVQEFINQFCDSVDAAPTPDTAKLNGCQTFGSYYRTLDVNAGKQPQAIQMQENLAEIQKIYAKMTSEGRLHINSSSYKRMRDSVKAVCEMGFNPYSEASVKEMQKRLKEMHEATAAYVEKRVDGKTKKTDLGVTRGNEALLLMRLSGETASVDKIKITDKRLEKGKKATTLSELMAQEKPAAKGQAPKHSSRQHQKSVSITAEQSQLS